MTLGPAVFLCDQLEELLRQLIVGSTLLVLTSCTSSAAPTPVGTDLGLLQTVAATPDAVGEDTFEVWVCEVPPDTTDPIYGELPLRLQLDPDTIANQLNAAVPAFFETLSDSIYQPTFVPGHVLTMAVGERHDGCVERAVQASSADAVLVVANAEHIATSPGGWGRAGSGCTQPSCPASATSRAAYVGASDFHPSWGDAPAVDLIEHEIGHTLGWVHSGGGENRYDSALDLMSNSAAPRESNPRRRGGGDTLAINRYAVGWLPLQAMSVATRNGGSFSLSPANGDQGQRLLVLPVSDTALLTIEYLRNDGLNDFLPEAGLSVHLIDQSQPGTYVAVGSPPPYTDLLDHAGDSLTTHGWTITVTQITDGLAGLDVLATRG
jgi:hypothetical protein